jgi:hypothetical protein
MKKFDIQIASVPDREKLVAEIWFDNVLLVEINQENENLEVQLYPFNGKIFNQEEFLRTIEIAKKKLTSSAG